MDRFSIKRLISRATLALLVVGATGASAQTLTRSPTSIDFGGQSMNTTSPGVVVTVTNTSAVTLTVSSVTVSAQFGRTTNCTSVAPSATCTITVTFSPSVGGGGLNSTTVANGTLTITSNAAGSPHTVSLTGIGEKSLVTHYYRAILRRAPDSGGKTFWSNEAVRVTNLGLNVNEAWFAMAQNFYTSGEYLAFNRNNTEYVTDLYNTFFNRAPDSLGLNFWVGQLGSGMPREVALVSFMFTTEFTTFTTNIFGNTAVRAEIDMVTDFYRGILARLPDDGGFNFWLGRFRAAQCGSAAAVASEVEGISSAYTQSGEYASRGRSNAQFVGDMYNAFLRRGGDLGGVNFWIGQLNSGALTREQLRVQFKNSPEFQVRVTAVTNQGCFAGTYPWPTWTGQVITTAPSTTGKTYYVDGTNGNNANTGLTVGSAFKTIVKAVSLLAAGDTILIKGGLYREPINLKNAPTGTATKPITVGSFGDAEVIVDGSAKVTGWTNQGGTVWRAPVAFTAVGVVVNEVPLKQVRQGQNGSTAPQEGIAGVTSGSGKWFNGGTFIHADFGTVIGSGDPNSADIVVPNNVPDQEHVFWYYKDYLVFRGLTVRGSGSNGMWGFGSNVTVDQCNVKFNGKSAVSFQRDSSRPAWSDNAVTNSHAYHNNLVNWPRGNNFFGESGGGWPGTVVWQGQLRPLARGNIVHMNGGEGIISYGAFTGTQTGSALFEQNIAHDNWSVNMYFDNQPNDVARQNFLFNHAPDPTLWLWDQGFPWNTFGKYHNCLMLANEQNSTDGVNGSANLAGTVIVNNIMAGCRISIREYSEGSPAINNHGLKDTIISNNTIILPFHTYTNTLPSGIYLQNNGSRDSNTKIQNNIVYGFNNVPVVHSDRPGGQALTGVSLDYNVYFHTVTNPFESDVTRQTFAQWKTARPGSDVNSKFQDPLFIDVTQFRGGTPATVYDYSKAILQATSPALGAGTPQTWVPANNFAGTARGSTWNAGAY